MSVRTLSRVWELSAQSGPHLLMLLALADFADDDGNAYPSVSTLARKCRMQPRNAQILLSALRDSGELQVRPNEGPKGANRYRIVLKEGVQELAGVQSLAGVQELARRGAKPCAKPLQGLAPEPSLNRQEPSEGTRAARARPVPGPAAEAKPSKQKPAGMSVADLVAEGVPEQTAADWLAVRKAKKAGPVTPSAWAALQREAKAAGLTTVNAVTLAAERGWQSFRREYLDGSPGPGRGPARRPPVLDADDPL